ncbi:MAG: hypothetical protein JWO09_207 [Bacteroidetes bacterium]|nr:hypothetical protein [Bacteroidota bacterium]
MVQDQIIVYHTAPKAIKRFVASAYFPEKTCKNKKHKEMNLCASGILFLKNYFSSGKVYFLPLFCSFK